MKIKTGLLVLMLGMAGMAQAAVQLNDGTIHPKIQDAVNVATNGDTLKIEAGTYVETVVISNKHLTLEGGYNGSFSARDGGDSVVDALQLGSTLWIMDSSSRVDRVHLTGGTGYAPTLWCGGGSLLTPVMGRVYGLPHLFQHGGLRRRFVC